MNRLARIAIGTGIGLAIVLSSGCSECVGVNDDCCENGKTNSKLYVAERVINEMNSFPFLPCNYTNDVVDYSK